MKKLKFLFFGVLFVHFSYGQSKIEREKIIKNYELSSSLRSDFNNDKYSINRFIEDSLKLTSLSLPFKIFGKDGNESQFVRFDGNLPLYYETLNAGSAITSRANLVQPGGSLGLNLTGLGIIVGVWDQNHPRTNHSDYGTRISITDGSAVSMSNHSTHVTGTILSSGANNIQGRGIAYQSEGWINDWTNDIGEMDQYASFGLMLSNHSYGLVATSLPVWYFGAYVSDSNAVDAVCFNHPKYQPVYAAGNDRDNFSNINPTKNGNDLLTGDKTSKNSLVIGAVNNVPNYLDNTSVVMSSFSNFGPTDDFRIKPDLVTKGVDVLSTTSNSTTSYGILSGTSMAAPGVTGGLALLQQYFGDPFMNSSTLRGLVIHTADEAGPSIGPDNMFGWGLINIGKSAQVLLDRGQESIVEENTLQNNQTYTKYILANEIEDIKATISWTDRPGAVVNNVTDNISPRLVNDLDIRVSKLDEVYYPWKLNKDFNNLYALQGDNNVDNVEKIEIANTSGIYQISVSHKGNLVGNSQNYSLIITGIDADANLLNQNFELNNEIVVFFKNGFLNYRINNLDYLNKQLVICDINGRVLKSSLINKKNGLIDISGFSKGVYIVKVDSNENLKRFVKKILN